MRNICISKATHIFAAKNVNVFENSLATIINEFISNELIKITML